MKKIFISHSQKDLPIVDSFVDDLLVGALSVKRNKIFCTSKEGTKINSGEDWRGEIQKALQSSKITILIITPNYKQSEMCLCEMGAAWVTSSELIPFIVEPITYSRVGVPLENRQVEKLLDHGSLDRLRDIVREKLDISPEDIKSDCWTIKKEEFLKKVKAHLEENPFQDVLSREEFDRVLKENRALEKNIQSLSDENDRLKKINEDLKKTKDRNDVRAIEGKYVENDSMGEFINLCERVSENLKQLEPVIRYVVFVSYSGKPIEITCQDCNRAIFNEALANDYITEDCEADWDSTGLMNDIGDALDVLGSLSKT